MKKLAALILCLVTVLSLALPVGARNFLYKSYTVDENGLVCIGAPLPEKADVTVTVNGAEVAAELSTILDEQIPVTYICIVDCSNGLTAMQTQQQLDVMNTISKNMRPQDSMAFFCMSVKMSFSPAMSTQKERDAFINSSHPVDYGTHLYDNIIRSLKRAKSDKNYPGLRCVVLMTDGRDDPKLNTQLSDVLAAIDKSELSLNTVALLNTYPDVNARQWGADLVTMADRSHGGIGYVMNVDDISAEAAAKQIMDTFLSSAVIKLSADQLPTVGDTEVAVSFRNGSGSVTIPAAE